MDQQAHSGEEPAGPGDAPLDEAAEATRGSVIKLGAEAAGRVLGLATTLLIARGLGVAEFGVFATLSAIAVLIAEVGELGLQTTASRALVAGAMSLSAMVRAKLALSALMGAVFAGLLVVSPLLASLVLYFGLAGWTEFLGVALRARGRRVQEAVVILTLRAAGLLLAAAVLSSGAGLRGVASALAASTVPAIVVGAVLTSRAQRGASEASAETRVGAILRSSLPLAVNGCLALLSLRVELFALAAFRVPREAGLFAAALKVVEFLNMVPSAVSAGAMPALTREGLRGSGLVRRRTAGTVALLAVPAAAGMALVAPQLVSRLFGAAFAPAAAPLRVLAPAVVVLFLNTLLLHALIAVGKADRLPRITALRVMAAVALALALVPALGGVGAAAGFLFSELLLLGLAARACAAARFEVPLAGPIAVASLASIPMGVAVVLAGAGLFQSVVLGALTYGVTLAAIWRLSPWLLEDS